jgi:hypothetical protein
MPDAALALLEIGLARERDVDGEVFHLPGSAHTTARAFLAEARRQTGRGRVVVLPSALVRVGALAVPLAREFADILHLWEAPVLLDGAKLRARFRATRFTPYADGIAQTLAWLRENPGVRMYF